MLGKDRPARRAALRPGGCWSPRQLFRCRKTCAMPKASSQPPTTDHARERSLEQQIWVSEVFRWPQTDGTSFAQHRVLGFSFQSNGHNRVLGCGLVSNAHHRVPIWCACSGQFDHAITSQLSRGSASCEVCRGEHRRSHGCSVTPLEGAVKVGVLGDQPGPAVSVQVGLSAEG